MKIDIYTHYLPPGFLKAFNKRVHTQGMRMTHHTRAFDMEWNLDLRFEFMDKFEDLVQVLTPTGYPLENLASSKDAIYLAKLYNDEFAELLSKYPNRFIAAVSVLPFNDIDAAMTELDRAIKQLGLKGVHMNTPVNCKPLDSPEFFPIYEAMVKHDLPIWIHPRRLISQPDYEGEKESKYRSYIAFGWPYETTLAMVRLVCGGIMLKYPKLKFITHHAGAMIPFLAGRLEALEYSFVQEKAGVELSSNPPKDYFKLFYGDTALSGNPQALKCAHAFFGTEHMLFGTDAPYGPGHGEYYTRIAIEAIDRMDISDADKEKILEGNAKKILKLSK